MPGKPGRLLGDLERALYDDPGHISLYELTIEPGTALAASREDLKSLPDEVMALEEWESALKYLKEKGYDLATRKPIVRPKLFGK